MSTTAKQPLKVDEAARIIPRLVLPEGDPVARVKITRAVVVGAPYLGVDVQLHDIIWLTRSETARAVWEGWGQPLEDFPQPLTGKEPFYANS